MKIIVFVSLFPLFVFSGSLKDELTKDSWCRKSHGSETRYIVKKFTKKNVYTKSIYQDDELVWRERGRFHLSNNELEMSDGYRITKAKISIETIDHTNYLSYEEILSNGGIRKQRLMNCLVDKLGSR